MIFIKKQIDYKGQRFGILTIISDRIRKNNSTYYLCQCDCGNVKEVRFDHLKSGATKSCGCLRKKKTKEQFTINLVGNRFGRLTVIEQDFSKNSHRGVYWFCKCDCGKIVSVCSADLKSKRTQSCGCLQSDTRHQKRIDLTGQIFNYLQVISLDEEKTNMYKTTYWKCKCLRCNSKKIKSIKGSSLKDGSIKSCGCLKSYYEEKIETILINNNINFQREYSFEKLRGKKRKLFFDFAIFDKDNNLRYLIEYNGEQHYKIVDYWGGEEAFNTRKQYDELKQEYCFNNNIPLIILNKNNKLTKEDIIKEDLLYG